MPIIADIEDLAPAEFLLMLSLNRKSGKLTAVREQHKLVIAFRNGAIAYAASSAGRERVGTMLMNRGLVTKEVLDVALRKQQDPGEVRHLGTILIEMGAITPEHLQEVVQSQFKKVLGDLMAWDRGVLTFTGMDIPDLGAVEVNPRDILVDMGFETEQLVLDSLSTLEDSRKNAVAQPVAATASPEARSMVDAMLAEMRKLSPSITAEATSNLLAQAAEVVERAVLLLVHVDHLSGVGGFGFDGGTDSGDADIRRVVIPHREDSVFSWVLTNGRSYQGPLKATVHNSHFIGQLGGTFPDEVIAVPMLISGVVAAILYGDNALSGQSIGRIDWLEAVMDHTARAVEAASI